MKKVASIRVSESSEDPTVVFNAVAQAMRLANWSKYVSGNKIVLKVNAVWDKIFPSCTTTPMVIEGVIRVLKSNARFKNSEITIVDTDTAAIMNADIAFRIQGIVRMAKKYGVKVVNLTNTKFREVGFNGLVLKKLRVSEVLLRADTIITMPVLKTHSYSYITGALKNQWGCIHDLRHNHHMVLDKAIADVNMFFKDKVKFVVYDALFGMEGKGPKTGNPRKVGYILASDDLVASDVVACRIMGLDASKAKHIHFAQKIGVGEMQVKIIGNKIPHFKFKPAGVSNLVMYTEMKLRHLGPLIEKALFDGRSPLLLILRWMAKIYYDVWYLFYGKALAKKILKTTFGQIWLKTYLSDVVAKGLT